MITRHREMPRMSYELISSETASEVSDKLLLIKFNLLAHTTIFLYSTLHERTNKITAVGFAKDSH